MARLLLAMLAVLSVAISARAGENGKRPPNIVFIVADDLGINDLGCYGRKDQPTPNLDRLAKQGIRFTNAYTAASVCSPTRASILTGKAPARLHLTTFLPGRPDTVAQMLLQPQINQQLPAGERTIADRLKTLGYVSALIGKWHLGGKGCLPTDRGFDLYHPGKAATVPSATEGGKGEYDLTIAAEKFLDANRNRPFFLCLAHNNPHVVLGAKAALIEKHKASFNPVYAAMVETLDDCVGRIVAKIEALGLTENTLIVFTSDNGGLHVLETPNTPATYNRPFRAGKGFLYEGGVRVPLLVRWDGKIRPGQTIDVPVISTDWTPTWLAVAGLATNEAMDGVSLLDLMTANKALAPRALFWHEPHYTNQGGRPAGAIRDGSWKMIEHYDDGRCELFDLSKDPGETTDLGVQQPGRIADLRGKLEKWRRDVGAQENKGNPHYNGTLGRQLRESIDVSKLAADKTAAAMAPKLESWRRLMNDALPSKNPKAGAGAILLRARDAKVHGTKLRYEPPPQKDTLGFWVERGDWAEWEFETPSAGTFELEVLQGCGKGSGGAEVEFAVKNQTLVLKVEETGHFQRFVPRVLGTLRLDAPGRYTLTMRAKTKPGGAVMDLRRVVLKAAP
jgi:arylsulfatase A-like enzyme